MSAVIEAFKVKPFDLEPIYAAWTSPPTFQGNPKKDLPVEDWLNEIKKGCAERRVPKEYWHKVGYHYMGPKARARIDEVKKVMRNMHGGKYRWNWKAFKVAMNNMGCKNFISYRLHLIRVDLCKLVLGDGESEKTEEIKVQSKASGIWWIIGKGKNETSEKECDIVDDAASISSTSPRPPAKRSKTTWDISTFRPFPAPKRSSTMSHIETVSEPSSIPPPTPPKTPPKPKKIAKTGTSEKNVILATPSSVPVPATCSTSDPGTFIEILLPFLCSDYYLRPVATTVGQAPVWLLNACQALDFLTTEHPKVMTAISAVLITVGSIPAIPAISAGAGGAFLASGTAHALGSIAVGIGSWLKATGEQQTNQSPPAQGHIQPA